MTIENLFSDARNVLTVLSLLTFLGIVCWSFSARRKSAYDEAANLPFADEADEIIPGSIDQSEIMKTEKQHG
ncbi:hypothetical protein BH11PSE11_BH11PSE11_26130 [soil metagenome]